MGRKTLVAGVVVLTLAGLGSAVASEFRMPGRTMDGQARATQGAIVATRDGFVQDTYVRQGGSVEFASADPIWDRAIVSVGHKGGKALFSSPVVAFGQSSFVKGVEHLEPGDYIYTCRVHDWWTGVLHVIPAGRPVDVP